MTVSDTCVFSNHQTRAITIINGGNAEVAPGVSFQSCGCGIWSDKSASHDGDRGGPFVMEDVPSDLQARARGTLASIMRRAVCVEC